MKDKFYDWFRKLVIIRVTGKNVYRYLNRLISMKINIYDSKVISYHELIIQISYADYLKLKDKRGIYKVKIVKYRGMLFLKEMVKKYYLLMFFILLGISLIIFLSNVIFSIEVVHTNREVREFMLKELKQKGITKYSFRKDYKDLVKVKESILKENKDHIEWLEIINEGTKYIIKLELRKFKEKTDSYQYQNIISSKNAIIKEIRASSGEVIKLKNDYVTRGEVVIGGSLIMPNGTVIYTKASGIVLGEVWYVAYVNYPYIYQEEKLTGKVKDVYVINYLNKRISLFDYHKYNSYQYQEKKILSSSFSFFKLTKEKQYEMHIIDEYNTKDEAINKAIERSINKIKDNLQDEEKILDYDLLETSYNEEGVKVKIFIKVLENISIPEKINIENG